MAEDANNTFQLPPTGDGLPSWTTRYPEPFRSYLARYGEDDRGEPVLIAYNQHLIAVAEACQNKSDEVFRQQYARVFRAWVNIVEIFVPQLHPQMERQGIYILREARWIPHLYDEDQRLLRSDKAAQELAKLTGIMFTDSMFARMRDVGRGPYRVGGGFHELPDLARWATYTFDIPPEGPSLSDLASPPKAPAVEPPERPRWLLAADCVPETDDLRDLLEGFGADVMRVATELEAAQAVSSGAFAGMILRLNNRVDAEFVIADICLRRGIPFVVITNNATRPAAMAIGGVLLHEPRGLQEVHAALEALPAHRTAPLDFVSELTGTSSASTESVMS
jgi:hypothetical protein